MRTKNNNKRCLGNRLLTLAMAAIWSCGTAAAAEAVTAEPIVEMSRLTQGEWGTGRTEIDRLKRFYATQDHRLVWPGREASLDLAIAAVAAHGLDPEAYAVERVTPGLSLPVSIAPEIARDMARSAVALRLVGDLHSGRVQPGRLFSDWGLATPYFDAAVALADALRGEDIAAAILAQAPKQAEYTRLKAALQRYRAMAAEGGWPGIDTAGGTLDPDKPDSRRPVLVRRLVLGGDLAADAKADDPTVVAAALRRFQARHGLTQDGRAGARTLAELNVTAEQRVEQIIANLERWRWLPGEMPERYVSVNVADQMLDIVEYGVSTFRSRVVVGAVRHPTPVLQAQIVAVTINPAWNIPHSIARKEILPKLKRNPAHLRDNDMVIRNALPEDPHGLSVDWRAISPGRFPYVLQQRPGAKNALGRIKLELPNRFDVYLHDTPSKSLFARSERFFSHGCVRVQDIQGLAQRVLERDDLPPVAEGVTASAPLRRPLPVFLLYNTAFVDADGTMQFRLDGYGRDTAVTAALARQALGPAMSLSPEKKTQLAASRL